MNVGRVELSYNRKIRVAKLKLAIGVVLFVMIASLSLFGNQLLTVVHANDKDISQGTSYRSVYIEPGDTLWSIAEENMTDMNGSIREFVNEIYSLNNLKSGDIRSGGYLIIPV